MVLQGKSTEGIAMTTATAQGMTPGMRAAIKLSAKSLAADIREELADRTGSPEFDYQWDPDYDATPDDMIAEQIENNLDMLRDDAEWGMLLDNPYLAMMAAGGNSPEPIHDLFYRMTRYCLYRAGDAAND
jgi:hypothetical protein